jgi:hypothetical protein
MSPEFWRGFREGLSWPITWPLGWGCYWLGDGVARVMNAMPEHWPDWAWDVPYAVYNRLMLASLRLSDTFGLGIWGPVEPIPETPTDTSSEVQP